MKFSKMYLIRETKKTQNMELGAMRPEKFCSHAPLTMGGYGKGEIFNQQKFSFANFLHLTTNPNTQHDEVRRKAPRADVFSIWNKQ